MFNCNALLYRYLCVVCALTTLVTVNAQGWKALKGTLPQQLTGLYANKTTHHMLVSSLRAGIYKSKNAGASWVQVLNTQDSLYSLEAVDGRVFVAGSVGAIYRSLDSGHTWQRYPIGNMAPVGRMAVLPSGKIVAATGSVWDRLKTPAGVMISNDTGKTWSKQNNGIGKDNALIEALSVADDGTLFIGIRDENVGLKGKYGLFKSVDEANTWQRLSLDIDLPFNVHYEDVKVRVGSVFNIAIANQHIVAAIEGVYTNFAYAFSVIKPLAEVDNASSSWKVHWVEDSLPDQGSYYEQTVNIYTDSKDGQWLSVSGGGEYNSMYRGNLPNKESWRSTSQGLGRGLGRYIFAEDGLDHLFATNYYFGDSIYVFDLEDIHTDIWDDKSLENDMLVYPNPYTQSGLYLKSNGRTDVAPYVQILDLAGHVVFEKGWEQGHASVYEVLPIGYELKQGFYFLHLRQGTTSLHQKFVAR